MLHIANKVCIKGKYEYCIRVEEHWNVVYPLCPTLPQSTRTEKTLPLHT